MFKHQTTAKPFIKWVGGKRRLASKILDIIGDLDYDCYYEPFLGGGAVFFALQPHKAVLSDINRYLIAVWQEVKFNPDRLIEELKEHQARHSKEYYLEVRSKWHLKGLPADTLYLTHYGFGGKFRVNSKGEFNNELDKRLDNISFDYDNLLACSQALQNARITCQPFTELPVKPNCLYYFDPPYYKIDQSYMDKFDISQQYQLSHLCEKIDLAGGHFIVSNSNTPFIKNIYKNYRQVEVPVYQPFARRQATELLITNIAD